MATAARDQGGIMGFLREALALLTSRRLVAPVLVLAVLLTASNIVIASNIPPEGNRLGGAFAVAALIRVAGLLILAVAILRIMTGSPRSPYVPDAGFWLYSLTFVLVTGLSIAVRLLTGATDSLAGIAIVNVIVGILSAPFAVWFAALAIQRPVPWSPAPFLQGLGRWLPYFIFWTLAVVTPLAILHAYIDTSVVKGGSEWFWPLMLFDGPLSTVMAVFGISLVAAAYRRVARS